MTASDTRCCEMATGPQPTHFLSAGYMYPRVSYGLYGPPAGVLRWHQHVKYPQLTRKTCRRENRTCVHTCGQVRAIFVWNTDRRVLSAENCAQQQLSPTTCPQGFPERCDRGFTLSCIIQIDKPLSHLSGQALQPLLPAIPRRKHAPVSISHGSLPDLPASVHASPICTQISFEHTQNFVRVSCWYSHADVITKHQQEARKGRNLLVYNPLKVGWQWTCGRVPARVTCGHIASI